jgi:hypothetical protein
VSGEDLEVVVGVQQRYRRAYRCGTDETVDQLPDRFAAPAASTIESSGLLVIGWLGLEK